MLHDFFVIVPYKGKDVQFNVNMQVTGYTYKFFVRVNETDIILEKDEEGNYRAIKAHPETNHHHKEIDIELLIAIQEKIEKAFE